MVTIIYGALKHKQVRHAVYCLKCRETVESFYEHDYKMCLCGLVGVDGGIYEGNRYIGKPEDMEIRSVYRASVNGKYIWLSDEVEKIETTRYVNSGTQMIPCLPCSICKESHPTSKCIELTQEIREPNPPQPTGPRGQGEDDD
jgi:hypothetical protein